jgi:hypothetical protein
MQMETKYLRLRTPVEFGTRFGDWQVCWLGGWARFLLYYLVMPVKVPLSAFPRGCDEAAPIDFLTPESVRNVSSRIEQVRQRERCSCDSTQDA